MRSISVWNSKTCKHVLVTADQIRRASDESGISTTQRFAELATGSGIRYSNEDFDVLSHQFSALPSYWRETLLDASPATIYQVVLRSTGEALASFDSLQAAEWFAHHNLYVPEQLQIARN